LPLASAQISPEGSSKRHHPMRDPVGAEDNGLGLEAGDESDPRLGRAKAGKVIAASKTRRAARLNLRQGTAPPRADLSEGNPVVHLKARQTDRQSIFRAPLALDTARVNGNCFSLSFIACKCPHY
jgi:hypothetical protein